MTVDERTDDFLQSLSPHPQLSEGSDREARHGGEGDLGVRAVTRLHRNPSSQPAIGGVFS